ncbi:hypothetical protein CNMCM6106_008359 [Aspergillus hiratsukae]|uniref:Uncharacterized protein n=1 Tax=Aspergillus hiratsukae TaxID=1194566 RepID=A0A8H6V164_9EURO|nr:hypothetical protein CNMCM6106_008359 [Aspergillus hiratsukae]
MLSAEVAEQTGHSPVSASETAASAANTNSLSSSWFVNFSEDSTISLPTRLRLFGTVTNARFLTRKVTIIQYAASAAHLNTPKKGIPTTALSQTPIAALQDAFIAMDRTQRTSPTAHSALKRVLLAPKPNEQKSGKQAQSI